MSDISLLPEELRRKEAKELKAKKKIKKAAVEMVYPQPEKAAPEGVEKSLIRFPFLATLVSFLKKLVTPKTKERKVSKVAEPAPEQVKPLKVVTGRGVKKEKISLVEKFFGTKEEREAKRLAKQEAKEARAKKEALEKISLAKERLVVEESGRVSEARPPKEQARVEKKEEKVVEKEPRPELPQRTDEDREKFVIPPPQEQLRFLGINLLHPREFFRPVKLTLSRKLVVLGWTFLISLVLLSAFWGGLFWYEQDTVRQIQEIDQKILLVNQKNEVLREAKEEAQELLQHSRVLAGLFKNHLYWTNFFTFLEKHTTSQVYYTNLTAKSSGEITLTARAQDYEAAAQEFFILQKADFVQDVRIDKLEKVFSEGGSSEVHFNIYLILDPLIFLKN